MGLYGSHLVNHIQHPELTSDNTLHVVMVLSNPIRVHSRLRLFREAYQRMLNTKNVKVYVVETAFGDRDYEVAEEGNPYHLRLRNNSEIWIKESMINLAFRYLLPRDWKYAATVDADIEFRDPAWALEAIHQLQHFSIIQPWSHAADLNPHGGVTHTFKSFGFQWQRGVRIQTSPEQPYEYAHTGFAWAFTRAFYEVSGGLIDWAIAGSGDHHMAWGCVGQIVESSVHGKMSDDFKQRAREWQNRVLPLTQKQVGFVNGRIEHNFHGPKLKRGYRTRWDYLIANNFEPTKDLFYDEQGLVALRGKPALEHAMRKYNRDRTDDSIEE